MKQISFALSSLFFLAVIVSCNDLFENKKKDYDLTIITQKIDDSNKSYPDEIVSFLIPEPSKDCGDTVLQVTVKLLRIDLPNEIEESLTIPRSGMENFLGAHDDPEKIKSKFKKEVKIAKSFSVPNGELDEFKLLNIVRKFGGAKNVIGYNSENSKFVVGGEGVMFYSDIKQLRQDLLNRVCTSNSSKFLILYNIASGSEDSETENYETPPPFVQDTNPFAVEIRNVLVNIIHKKTTSEKLKLAIEANEKYFDSQCIVKNYQSLSNPNLVDVYGSGNGGIEYLRYLATDPSITDIQIKKIERDLKTNKITALYVFEKHN